MIAGVSVFSGDGIDINAGATDTVILRGLTVNNQGSTGNGIVFNSGRRPHIENCVASGFITGISASSGILIAGPGKVSVKDSIARGNRFGVILSRETANSATVVMDRVQLDGNSTELVILANASGAVVHAAIRNSSASGNIGNGIEVDTIGGSSAAFLDVESCLMTNNDIGIAGSSAFASISNCTITQNRANGFVIAGGTILSRGNNTISDPNIGNLTPLAAR